MVNRLATLFAAARQVNTARDAKLAELQVMIDAKYRNPINPGNRKVIVFTAFQVAPWAKASFATGVRP